MAYPMKTLISVLLPWILCTCAVGQEMEGFVNDVTATYEKLKRILDEKDDTLMTLANHVMVTQFQNEERIRAEGDSGIVQIRNYRTGPNNYDSYSHIGHGVAGIHDHSRTRDLLGFGELTAVLNGVQFRTGHNDYKLRRRSTSSLEFGATEDIQYPEVPESVLEKGTVEEQITEMQEYFRAFREQDTSIRDYRSFFPAVICFLEGAWLDNDILGSTPDEDLDREIKISLARIEAYLGAPQDPDNGTPQLPVTIMGVDRVTKQIKYATYNVTTLCHPIDEDIPTSNFHLVDDLDYRVREGFQFRDLANKRGARYVLWDENNDKTDTGDSPTTLLERIVSKMPGKDNIPADNHVEKNMGLQDIRDPDGHDVLDLGYYNRKFVARMDAMNQRSRVRGYNDANMYVALTSQPEVAPLVCTYCSRKGGCGLRSDIRASWMIPLEIVYLTPLSKWNPYDIVYHEGDAPEVDDGGSANCRSEEEAYNGARADLFYRTPAEFFGDAAPADPSPADTGSNPDDICFVRDVNGVARQVKASGTRVMLPDPTSPGKEIRLRYPIMPIHGEGSGVWKKLNALQDNMSHEFEDLAFAMESTDITDMNKEIF